MEKEDAAKTRKEITNLSTCTGATPAGTSLFHTHWRQDFLQGSSDPVSLRQVFKFESGAVNVALTCSKGTMQTTVQVRASASVVGTQIRILSQDSAEGFLNDNGALISCKAEIFSGTVFDFQFNGPCLELIEENGTARTLVPTLSYP